MHTALRYRHLYPVLTVINYTSLATTSLVAAAANFPRESNNAVFCGLEVGRLHISYHDRVKRVTARISAPVERVHTAAVAFVFPRIVQSRAAVNTLLNTSSPTPQARKQTGSESRQGRVPHTYCCTDIRTWRRVHGDMTGSRLLSLCVLDNFIALLGPSGSCMFQYSSWCVGRRATAK